MKDRAQKSKLGTFRQEDNGATFLGSSDFPPGLVDACLKNDPKGIVFGTESIIKSPPEEKRKELKTLFDARIKGKKFLVCSGTEDKLVPYANSAPFLDFLTEATQTWYKEGGVYLENKVYDGVGHEFSQAMTKDAVGFLVYAAARDNEEKDGEREAESRAKI